MADRAVARMPGVGVAHLPDSETDTPLRSFGQINRTDAAERRRAIKILGGFLDVTSFFRSKTFGFALTTAIVGLTLVTANIHLGLGGLLFTLNGLGYIGLATLYVVAAAAPMPIVQRFSWFPRVALIGYAALTIAAYLVMGPYFTLGWIAKGVEAALIVLVAVDVIRVYGSPMGFVRAALESVAPALPSRFRPTAA